MLVQKDEISLAHFFCIPNGNRKCWMLFSSSAFNILLKQPLLEFMLPFIQSLLLAIQGQDQTNVLILLITFERSTFLYSLNAFMLLTILSSISAGV